MIASPLESPFESPLIVAMDFDSSEHCLALAKKLDPLYCRLKIGKELFTVAGPAVVEQLGAMGFDVFLDLKFHDIPNTVAKAVKAAARLGVWMVNVHASGGEAMMAAARESLDAIQGKRPLLIGVTVLTSMSVSHLQSVGVEAALDKQVLHLARLARTAKLDGVVCSAQEAAMLKSELGLKLGLELGLKSSALGSDFSLVTPGIRPFGAASNDDQHRVLTPREALAAGSDYLVIGRPITQADDPAQVCENIVQSILAS